MAERQNHHPEITLRWGQVDVAWTTHDVGGVSALDFELAGFTELAASEPLSR
jgi:4a-hydroxytetrahydrobiopterin dehydratase